MGLLTHGKGWQKTNAAAQKTETAHNGAVSTLAPKS